MCFRVVAGLLLAAGAARAAGADSIQAPARIERRISPEQTHIFEIELTQGSFLQAFVTAPKTLIDFNLIDPAGRPVQASSRRLQAIAHTAGRYQLKLSCPKIAVTGGAYLLTVEVNRTPMDRERTLDTATQKRGSQRQEDVEEAARLFGEAGDRLGQREAWRALGLMNYRAGNRTAAATWLQKEIDSAVADADQLSLARGAYWMGVTLLDSDPPKARTYFEQSVAAERVLGNDARLALSLIAASATSMPGDTDHALEILQEARAIAARLNDAYLRANVMTTEGNAFSYRGEFRKALEQYEASLPLHRQAANVFGEANAWNNVGEVLTNIGEWTRALHAFDQSIELWKKLQNRMRESYAIHNRARVYSAQARWEEAREGFQQAIRTFVELSASEPQAAAWNELGSTYVGTNEPIRALECAEKALSAIRNIATPRTQGYSLLLRSRAFAKMKRPQDAVHDALAALRLFTEIADRNSELLALEAAARAEFAGGQTDAAREHMRAAVDLIESGRADLERRNLQSTYVATRASFTELYVQILVALGRHADALGAVERFRARNLLEAMGDAAGGLMEATSAANATEERELRRRLRTEAAVLGQLPPADRERAKQRIESLVEELDKVAAARRADSNRAAAIATAAPMPTEKIRETLAGSGTAIVEFFLAEPHSFAWIVTESEVKFVELAGKREIEDAAQALRRVLMARSSGVAQRAAALDTLTVKPVMQSASTGRLAIAPDGALWYAPWRMLPSVSSREVVVLPSASIVAQIRGLTRGVPEHAVAILADPVFDSSDSRVARAGSSVAPNTKRFSRLRFSREEALAISQVSPPRETLRALDLDASREKATSAEIGKYRVVHFATHTLIDNEHPELSGIVLSLVDRRGEARDGFLRLFDIYRLRLSADLVVLSGCQSALGKEMRGEGLVGLTQGFLAAGADHVLATLWPVEDRATAEFMARFYRALLVGKKSPASALKLAQQSMRRDPSWQSPYYWAGFQLIGDWR